MAGNPQLIPEILTTWLQLYKEGPPILEIKTSTSDI